MESQFQLEHRKFIKYAINETGEYSCSSYCNSSDSSTFCQPPCFTFCPRYCDDFFEDLIPSPYIFSQDHPSKSRKLLIITVSIMAITFVALLCYAIFAKFYLGWWSGSRRISSPQRQIINETHDDFLDEEQGPVVDHPIWYIRTVGLQPSIISAITVLKYKKGDGLVEGTECSVCLSEFKEDETLRLLPKCSHAFHVSCVDTWLISHTNCPLCRAPIVMNTAGASSSSELNIENPGTSGNTQVEIFVNIEVKTERQLEDVVFERRNTNGTEEEGESQLEQTRKTNENSDEVNGRQPIRRSVSLDSVSASKMIQGLANFVSEENIRNSDAQLAEVRDLRIKIVTKKVGRSKSLLRIVGSSSIGRSLQNAPVSMKRSFSCSGKFLLSRSS